MGLGREERGVRQSIGNVAKQAWKLLAIELFLPGGTLVVLAILLGRVLASWRSRRLAVAVPAAD